MNTHGTFVAQDTDDKSALHDLTNDDRSALLGQKRKASRALAMQSHDDNNDNNQHRANELLQSLAEQIQDALNVAAPDEAVQQCGQAPLRIIALHPDKVLELAHTKLHASPFQSVPLQWRRLFEEASLHKVVKLLKARALRVHAEDRAKRRRIDNHTAVTSHSGDWLLEIVEVLDRGISLSGAPGRKYLFDGIFEQLGQHIANEATPDWTCFRIIKPQDLKSTHPIVRKSGPFDHETFQEHLRIDCQPVIITGAIENWPARQLWENPEYLFRHTLGGRRFVPVEVGESYVSDGWSQRMMPMRDFVETYLLPDDPAETGYLAQYDLFAQIPALRHDVRIPDICYSDPPPADADALTTAGLSTVEQLDEPLLNAWLGPKDTKTPLHTDPYHNVLCQVVGYKYVRLYPPSETDRLYPRGVDEKGINMENTSRVDMSRLWSLVHDPLTEEADHVNREFPLFQEARYVEAVLGPGDSLYVPLGWWHYVESLTTSFSVSFWWN